MIKYLRFILLVLMFYFPLTYLQLRYKPKKNIITTIKPCSCEKKFTFIVSNLSNEPFCSKNLSSIFSQNYSNFNVIYFYKDQNTSALDDVKKTVSKNNWDEKCTFIHIPERSNPSLLQIQFISKLADNDIVLFLDSSDWINTPDFLASLNSCYENDKVWLTYSQYITYPDNHIGSARPFRMSKLLYSQVNQLENYFSPFTSCYAGLVKNLNVRFGFNKDPTSLHPNQILQIALFQLARKHAWFTPEISFTFNKTAYRKEYEINRKKQNITMDDAQIAQHNKNYSSTHCMDTRPTLNPSQSPLKTHPKYNKDTVPTLNKKDQTDIVILSLNNASSLKNILNQIDTYLLNKGKTIVLYSVDNAKDPLAYQTLIKSYTNVEFIPSVSEQNNKTFHSSFKNLILNEKVSKNKYVLVLHDHSLIYKTLDLKKIVQFYNDSPLSQAIAFHLKHPNQAFYESLQDCQKHNIKNTISFPEQLPILPFYKKSSLLLHLKNLKLDSLGTKNTEALYKTICCNDYILEVALNSTYTENKHA